MSTSCWLVGREGASFFPIFSLNKNRIDNTCIGINRENVKKRNSRLGLHVLRKSLEGLPIVYVQYRTSELFPIH